GIDDSVLEALVGEILGCPAVLELGLAENRRVTDAGIACLAQAPRLISLNLSSCGLTNTGLESLSGLKQLVRLNLSYCNRITDAGVRLLKGLAGLRYLDLQGCVKVTNGSIAQIRRPTLTIHRP
ncbi:MAG TPA: leucine-rich repeat domain-containing protein, partial [Anaerolineaceae bacterium]